MNVNGTVSSFPSKVLESFCDKYSATVENGIAVNYRDTFAATAYDIFVNKQLDMYRIWIDTLHETEKKAWLSFRINDCHYNWQDTNV